MPKGTKPKIKTAERKTKMLNEIMSLIPENEKFSRSYRAFEGDLRVITTTPDGNEKRYRVCVDEDGKATLKKF